MTRTAAIGAGGRWAVRAAAYARAPYEPPPEIESQDVLVESEVDEEAPVVQAELTKCCYPMCAFADGDGPGLRACINPDCQNRGGPHHHVCAINAGQEDLGTLCFACYASMALDISSPVASDSEDSIICSQKRLVANSDTEDELSESEGEVIQGSPAMTPPRVKTPAVQVISPSQPASLRADDPVAQSNAANYTEPQSGTIVKSKPDGQCFYWTAIKLLSSSPTEGSFGSVQAPSELKEHIKSIMLEEHPSVANSYVKHYKFDLRVGAPPLKDDEWETKAKTLLEMIDETETIEDYVTEMMQRSTFGGTIELCSGAADQPPVADRPARPRGDRPHARNKDLRSADAGDAA